MSLRACPLPPDVIARVAELAGLPRWDPASLSVAVSEAPSELGDLHVDVGPDHLLVFDYPESPDKPRENAHVVCAVFYQPDEDDDPEDDELVHDWESGGGPSSWGLADDGTRRAFDAFWAEQRDAVSTVLGRKPAATVVEPTDEWRTALWPVGEHVLALAQTEHFESYSLFDMVALWVCRRPESPEPAVPDQCYRWMTEFPAILAGEDGNG